MPRLFMLIATSAAALAACDTAATRPETPPPEPPVVTDTGQTWLCGREYVNHAWGYQRRGVVFDTTGNVWRYSFQSSPKALVNPWGPKDMGRMSEEELKLRYNGAMVSGGNIPAEEIARHMPLIAEAAKAKPTEPKSVGADMGADTLYCYLYDPQSRTYAQVMLDQKGDWESTNPSGAAKTLAAWVNSRIGQLK
jgi:hypothetical protein